MRAIRAAAGIVLIVLLGLVGLLAYGPRAERAAAFAPGPGNIDYLISAGASPSNAVMVGGAFDVTVQLTTTPTTPFKGTQTSLVYDSAVVTLMSITDVSGALYMNPSMNFCAPTRLADTFGGALTTIAPFTLRAGILSCTTLGGALPGATGPIAVYHFAANAVTTPASAVHLEEPVDLPVGVDPAQYSSYTIDGDTFEIQANNFSCTAGGVTVASTDGTTNPLCPVILPVPPFPPSNSLVFTIVAAPPTDTPTPMPTPTNTPIPTPTPVVTASAPLNLRIVAPDTALPGSSFDVALIATNAAPTPYSGYNFSVLYDGALFAPPTGVNDSAAFASNAFCVWGDAPLPLPTAPNAHQFTGGCVTLNGTLTSSPQQLAHVRFTAPGSAAGMTIFHMLTAVEGASTAAGGTFTIDVDSVAQSDTYDCGPLAPYPAGNCGPFFPSPPFPAGTTGSTTATTFRGTGSITGHVYHDAATAPNALANVWVQACPSGAPGPCSSAVTDGNGAYTLTSLVAGDFQVTANGTGSYMSATIGPVTVTAGGTTPDQDVILVAPAPIPSGTTIESPTINGGTPQTSGVPVVHWQDTVTLTTSGCPGGTASYTLVDAGVTVASGPMTEGPAGTYTAMIPPLYPAHGSATVTMTVVCAGVPTATAFDIYIDPSGSVIDQNNSTVAGATVKLLRADSSLGPYTQVPNGSAIMSPSNQRNPDLTDATGHFGWDVIAGYYQVKASKPGCVSPADPHQNFVLSAALSIPPPVTDLSLKLDCSDTAGDGYPDALKASYGKPAAVYCDIMRADTNMDGSVNILDLSTLGLIYGKPVTAATARYDQGMPGSPQRDGSINILDLSKQANVFGRSVSNCPIS